MVVTVKELLLISGDVLLERLDLKENALVRV